MTRLENKIDKHIEKRADYTGPYGTTRQSSKDTAFKCLHSGIDNYWLKHIENVCAEPMKTLGLPIIPQTLKKQKTF